MYVSHDKASMEHGESFLLDENGSTGNQLQQIRDKLSLDSDVDVVAAVEELHADAALFATLLSDARAALDLDEGDSLIEAIERLQHDDEGSWSDDDSNDPVAYSDGVDRATVNSTDADSAVAYNTQYDSYSDGEPTENGSSEVDEDEIYHTAN